MGVEIKNAWKTFGEQAVLGGFSIGFPPRGTVCLFGPSGCGKSTLLNCLAGLITLDSGEILGLKGKKVSYIFQENRLLPWATARENVALVLEGENTETASRWLLQAGLGDAMEKYPRELSGGMKRRVAIARALAYEGDVLLLDEPFRALDETNKQELMRLIRGSSAGMLNILVTHDRVEAEQMGDVIIFLDGPPLRIVEIRKK